jgi:hypothetical protein
MAGQIKSRREDAVVFVVFLVLICFWTLMSVITFVDELRARREIAVKKQQSI